MAAGACAAIQIATPAPAHASISLVTSLPMTTLSVMAAQDGCSAWPVPRLVAPQPASLQPMRSKSEAILGGHVSRLEMIARQQQSAQAAQVPATPAALPLPAAGGARCQSFTLPQAPLGTFQPGLKAPASPDDFLASARVAVSRTGFDSEWNRVRKARVRRSTAEALVPTTRNEPMSEKLAAVNAWSNEHIRYREDSDLYHRADYWANAGETLRRRAGDCEDIAIVKMQMLAALGVPASDMFLTIARDRVRNADHAMLVVKSGGRYWLLDNATDKVLDASRDYDYLPIMSFSTDHKWLHGFSRTTDIVAYPTGTISR
ncbi:transglutaminase-like cysteine peptidase [Novosphingobium sp. ZN18A2]|uniref:transglutaminase-like cysteine peptidase n=1 Tax=Novosphingobium sp. ZN18A2 TaxID=3079861 RepID=UPI0030CD0F4A